MEKNPFAFGYADSKLKENKSVVLEAVARNGLALAYASRDLQADRDVLAMGLPACCVLRYLYDLFGF